MNNSLNKYNAKRDFTKTKEPVGKKSKSKKKLIFVVQHHIASKDHYDFRLEMNGILKSWAVPKGPSYNSKDKRLAILVEDHPFAYHRFEGVIPKGEYGAGPVMIWDEGTWEIVGDLKQSFKDGNLKFILHGKRLKGKWTLVHFKDNNWLLIKEKDKVVGFKDINMLSTSVKSGLTMEEIMNKRIEKKDLTKNITSPEKVIFDRPKITKLDIAKYYQKISSRMLPFLKDRIISTIRAPEGMKGSKFFKKHLEMHEGLGRKKISGKEDLKSDYYYIKDESGLIGEVQMNSFEFHIWGSNVKFSERPNMMVFDLDPDEKMTIEKVRHGVKDLKSILDELSLPSFLKTSGGKGYHVVVPFNESITWTKFRKIAKDIAKLMETKWPDQYVSNVRKVNRKNKIFIDWIRNTRGATSVAPYSIRLKDPISISMPISWNELDKVKPNEITMNDAIKRMKRKDPWEHFFD